jgi:hypothetical protein
VEYDGKFYIGRTYDPKSKKTLTDLTLYDPDDLTTHGVVVGMTGSGKTGLCIDILEEAALNGIPALLLDPKGDLANLLLHFPDLAPQDFETWIDAEEARREGKSTQEFAADLAGLWKKGLHDWGIEPERIARVRDAVQYSIYTPGSDAGLPISVLASLRAPQIPWEENRELLREKISSTVTALLSLVGIETDPVRSREHILVSNIFEHSWQSGQDLDLVSIIRQIQAPPFERLGALELDQFFPKDDRFEMAMALNNLLASPTFQEWMEGDQLDIERLLWTPEGKPRHTVFYMAHLSDPERMFFTTLLLTALEAWVRLQPGSPSLRAMLYFDEIFGFLPPVANPPSKEPILRLLKQARAFGFGLLLATQNPVDLDYKALSNAGTWFVGRLQTEQDKARLIDGLEGATSGQGGFNRTKVDKLISALGKRVFLLHNVHEKEPTVFQTRWAMAYLKGPITRTQLGELNAMVGAKATPVREEAISPEPTSARPAARSAEPTAITALASRPPVPDGVEEVFLPNNLPAAAALKAAGKEGMQAKTTGVLYKPALLAQAQILYLDRKRGIEHEQIITSLALEPERRGIVRWEEALTPPIDRSSLGSSPAAEAEYSDLQSPLNDSSALKSLEKDFIDYTYHNAELKLPSNDELKLVAIPGTSAEEFRVQCAEAARKERDAAAKKVKEQYKKKIASIQKKLTKEERELAEDESELSGRKMEEMATHAENVFGLFTGSRRRVSSSLTKRRMTAKAKADVEESVEAIAAFQQELEALEQQMAEELDDVNEHWEDVADNIGETTLKPYKKDVHVELFSVGWFPHWQLDVAGQDIVLPAFTPRSR